MIIPSLCAGLMTYLCLIRVFCGHNFVCSFQPNLYSLIGLFFLQGTNQLLFFICAICGFQCLAVQRLKDFLCWYKKSMMNDQLYVIVFLFLEIKIIKVINIEIVHLIYHLKRMVISALYVAYFNAESVQSLMFSL